MSLRARRRRRLKKLARKRRRKKSVSALVACGGAALWVSGASPATIDVCFYQQLYSSAVTATSGPSNLYAPTAGSGVTLTCNSSTALYTTSSICVYGSAPLSINQEGASETFEAADGVPATSLWIPSNATEERKDELRAEHRQWRSEYVRRVQESNDRLREQRLKSEAARSRARGLLLRHLTIEQRESFEKDKKFEVRAPSGNRYVIHDFLSANIEALDAEGKPQHRLCIHIDDSQVPKEDSILVQKIMLENGLEDELVRLANKHPVRPPLVVALPSLDGMPLAREGAQITCDAPLTYANPPLVHEGTQIARIDPIHSHMTVVTDQSSLPLIFVNPSQPVWS